MNVHAVRQIVVPVVDLQGVLADDGYPPVWLGTFVKRTLHRWRVANAVSFDTVMHKTEDRRELHLLITFTVGVLFDDDTERNVDVVADCIIQSLTVYGSVLSRADHWTEYHESIERQQALDGIVQGRNLRWASRNASMELSVATSRWLCQIGVMTSGGPYLVRH